MNGHNKRPYEGNRHQQYDQDWPSKKQKHTGRDEASRPSQAQQANARASATPRPTIRDLDAKHPSTLSQPPIPPYSPPPPRTLYTTQAANPPSLPALSPHLANAPFTHASFADTRRNESNYERLEFLGDAYLEIIASRLIFSRFPELPVGRQSLLREKLVRNSTLAGYSRMYGFGGRLKGIGLERQGDKAGDKVLGDVFEAYLGALVLSEGRNEDGEAVGGFSIAEDWLTELWVPILLEADPNITVVQNRKEELARLMGGKFIKIEYLEECPMTLTKDKSTQQYTMGVYLTGWGYEKCKMAQAVGVSKKEAGMKAAGLAIDTWEDFEKVKERKRVYDLERREAMAREAEKEGKGTEEAAEKPKAPATEAKS